MNKFWKSVRNEKVSLIGIFVSLGLFVFSYFVPFSVPVPVSQSVFDNLTVVGGYTGLEPVIAVSTIAVVLFSVFLIIGVVRIARKK